MAGTGWFFGGRLAACALLFVGLAALQSIPTARGDDAAPTDEIRFNRDIRPILSDNCFACHGPDPNHREADLRLDTHEGLVDYAVVPGSPDESELLRRILSTDDAERMPPPDTGKKLTEREVELLRRWIASGASWEGHWSLIVPRRPDLPQLDEKDAAWAINPIDHFVLARLQAVALEPSSDADKRTLVRRLYLDLLGLPPTPEQVRAFVDDESPQAYETLVDQLLQSPHYGERMAMYWLDLVRYADTAGYHSDNHRDVAPYRDYVIKAFNENLPFDQFTREQLAGDLLEQPTNWQRIASGYNRMLQTTGEGGAQPKEYAAKYAADRVRNLSTTWLGMTVGCAECHDHKFDPFTTREFYCMEAFFADIDEKAVGLQDQTAIPTPEQEAELAKLDAQLAELRKQMSEPRSELSAAQAEWEAERRAALASAAQVWTMVRPESVAAQNGTTLTVRDDSSVLASGNNPPHEVIQVTLPNSVPRITGLRLEALTDDALANKSLSLLNGNFVLSEVEIEATVDGQVQPVAIARAEADYSQQFHPVELAIDGKPETGWAVDGHLYAKDRTAVFTLATPLEGAQTLVVRLRHESPHTGHNIGCFRISLTAQEPPPLADGTGLPREVADALRADPELLGEDQRAQIFNYYRSIAPALADVRNQIAQLESQRSALVAQFPQTLVTKAVEPRTIRVLPRGNWLDDTGEIVLPAVPASIGPALQQEGRASRRDLADWLMSAENPLVARVFVNRLWKLCFGQGLVTTLEDFGTQGDWPSHPELLDWLAVEFRESGWNIKHMHRLMVLSHTYRQTSHVRPELQELDPDNRLLARQSRYRLDAELLRDAALSISGLLKHRIGGPSVKPYQPAGYWANLNFPKREWQQDHGDDLYRRGLYTYWCRSFLHPAFLAFDASTREECVANRPRSNTPIQALVLLNDPQFVEAARVLAQHMMANAETTDERIHYAMAHTLSRSARLEELAILGQLYEQHLEYFQQQPDRAAALLDVGEAPADAQQNPAELAAWTSVARTILNLHETITRN